MIKKNPFLKNKKGASLVIEQVFIVLFGIFLLIMVITVFTTLRDNVFDYVAERHFSSVANYVHNGVMLAAENMHYSDSGKIFLDLPDKVGDKPYKIILNETVINVTDLNGDINSHAVVFNINTSLSGNITSTGGGRVYLFFNKSTNNISLLAEEKVIS